MENQDPKPSQAENAPPPFTRISVRSRQQAMEWCLVLISQGIETTIQPPGENPGWTIVIPFRDSERAFQSLRQYRIENRNWPWRQQIGERELHFDWACLAWAGVMILFYALSETFPALKQGGVMDSAKVVSGQWWRIFTAIFLHADLGHLSTNLSVGIVLLGLAMGRFGTGTGLLAAYLAGAGGNLLSLLLNAKPFHGLGASGMIMGALGLLAAQSLSGIGAPASGPARTTPDNTRVPKLSNQNQDSNIPPLQVSPSSSRAGGRRSNRSWNHLLVGVMAGVMLFVLLGLTPGTDIAAHLGGFLTGLLLGAFLLFLPSRFQESPRTNLVSGVLWLGLVCFAWGMVLRK